MTDYSLHVEIDHNKITDKMFDRVEVDHRGFRYIYDPMCCSVCDKIVKWKMHKVGTTNVEINDIVSKLQGLIAKKKPMTFGNHIYRISMSNVSSILSLLRTMYEYIGIMSDDNDAYAKEALEEIRKTVENDEYLLAAVDIKAGLEAEMRGNVTIVERFSI